MKMIYTFFMPTSVTKLLQKDPDSALAKFAEEGNKPAVLRALLAGADPDAGKNEIQGSAVIRAAKNGHLEIVKRLVAKKADINLRNYNDRNALHEAISNAQEKTALYLLELDSAMELRDRRGNTALDAAIEQGLKKVARAMIEKGFNTEAKNKSGDDARDLIFRASWDDEEWKPVVGLIDKNRKDRADALEKTRQMQEAREKAMQAAIENFGTVKRAIPAGTPATFKKRPKPAVKPA